MGNHLTLADIIIFRFLRLLMITVYSEKIRKSFLKNLTQWFINIMESEEAIEVYGRTILCKETIKPFIEEEKNNFDLNIFKNNFILTDNKDEIIENFLNDFNKENYSFWYLEYNNLPNECKVLFKTCNLKNFILQKLEDFRKKCFGVLGVYENKNDYKINGVWMWKGNDIPFEIKNCDYYDFLIIQKLNVFKDKQFIYDFWTHLSVGDIVNGKKVVDVTYFR